MVELVRIFHDLDINQDHYYKQDLHKWLVVSYKSIKKVYQKKNINENINKKIFYMIDGSDAKMYCNALTKIIKVIKIDKQNPNTLK